ncbi:MAG TPA: FtsQ-type POTRA domain-containing protein [Propionibacterium sp.]|nr:FtsQ-type POTRA domain-containing protein [Propionibacterium sp.]
MKLRDLRARFATRRGTKKTGGRRWGRGLKIAVPLVVVAVGVLVWLFGFSSVFALKVVNVHGTSVLTPDEVLNRAEAPIGLPLARVDERAVGERVAGIAAVDEVTVSRRLPDKLEISVTERVPVFAVGNGDQVMLVDHVGAVFPGPRSDDLLAGEGPMGDPELLAEAATVVKALPPDLRARAQRVVFTTSDSITVHLDDDVEVFFGSAEEAEFKAQVAWALTRGTLDKHIDVSAPTRPSTR